MCNDVEQKEKGITCNVYENRSACAPARKKRQLCLRAGYRLTLGSLKKRNMESCQISAGAGV